MKERKRLPYLPLFIDDWMQSSGVCDCSDATRGIYIDLMCVLFKEKVRGAYSLHSKEMRWHYSRSKTQLALAKSNMSERLPYFVDFLVKPLRSTRSAILKALQELLYHDIIAIVNDVLIQPRMYRDYGGKLLDEGGEDERLALPDISEAKAVAAEDRKEKNKKNKKGGKSGAKKASENSAEKSSENPRARASCASARTESGSGSENKNNSIGSSKGGVGEILREGEKSNDVKTDATPSVKSDTPQDKPAQIPVADCPPTLEQIQAYMQEQGELGRIFRYITAEEYYDEGCKSGWMQRGGRPLYDWKAQLRSFEAYRRNHGDTPVAARGQQPTAPKQGDPVQATPPKDGKYRKW